MFTKDYHIHSNASIDGEYKPEEIIEIALKNNLKEIAITDHNSTSGIQNAIDFSKGKSIEVISGIEIDCHFEGINLHLLGYHINHNAKVFKELETNIHNQDMKAFSEKVYKMEKLGLTVDAENILKMAGEKAPSGELIGEVILENPKNWNNSFIQPYLPNGSRSNMPLLNFYWDFFAQGKVGHVQVEFPSVFEANQMIKEESGFSVIAHPGNNFNNKLFKFQELINQKFISGIEVFSTYHTPKQVKYFNDLSKYYHLIPTCGSDFHGKIKPQIFMGNFGYYIGYEEVINKISLEKS